MKNLEIKTLKPNTLPSKAKYITNLNTATLFLRHSEDRITAISGEEVNIEIYDNGSLVFLGSKSELYDILRSSKKEN